MHDRLRKQEIHDPLCTPTCPPPLAGAAPAPLTRALHLLIKPVPTPSVTDDAAGIRVDPPLVEGEAPPSSHAVAREPTLGAAISSVPDVISRERPKSPILIVPDCEEAMKLGEK
eukprot:6182368-Pleurochrysis_carterae.AAC.3